MIRYTLALIFAFLATSAKAENTIDCSEAYGSPATCQIIECSEKFKGFLGTWVGPFDEMVQELSTPENSVFRPFNNSINYSEKDCLENIENGDQFIIGRRTDFYPKFRNLPEKVKKGLLITGRHSNGSPFLRLIDKDDPNPQNYFLFFRDEVNQHSEWGLIVPESESNPEMRFRTIDKKDPNAKQKTMKVKVFLSLGPEDNPIWEGIVSQGFHTLYQ